MAKVPRFIGPMATRAGPGRPGVDRGRPGRFRGPPEDHFWNKWTRSLQNQSNKAIFERRVKFDLMKRGLDRARETSFFGALQNTTIFPIYMDRRPAFIS